MTLDEMHGLGDSSPQELADGFLELQLSRTELSKAYCRAATQLVSTLLSIDRWMHDQSSTVCDEWKRSGYLVLARNINGSLAEARRH